MNTALKTMTIGRARASYVSWLLDTRDMSPHTVRAYSCDVAALARTLEGEALVSDLDEATLLRFFEAQRVGGMRSSSLRRRVCGLRSFCSYLRQVGLLATDPWPTDSPRFRRVRPLPRAVPGDELVRLFGHLRGQADIG